MSPRAVAIVCVPCLGTGAEGHDCSLCGGDRLVTAEAASASGADPAALDGAGGLVRCPGCGGAPCPACGGSGTTSGDDCASALAA